MTLSTNTTSQITAIKARMKLPTISAPMFLLRGPQMKVNACKCDILLSFLAIKACTDKHHIEIGWKRYNTPARGLFTWAPNMITRKLLSF